MSLKKYRRYIEFMKANEATEYENVMFYNLKALQMMFDNQITFEELEKTEIIELLYTSKAMHYIAQEIITPQFEKLGGKEAIEVEQSIFDDYDKENGYEEDQEESASIWNSCLNMVDLITKTSIQLLRNSYAQVMETNIIDLITYLKYEIETAKQK